MFASKGTPEINTQGLHAIPTFTVQILAKIPHSLQSIQVMQKEDEGKNKEKSRPCSLPAGKVESLPPLSQCFRNKTKWRCCSAVASSQRSKYFVFCRLYPSTLSNHGSGLAPTCHISTVLIAGAGLPIHMI